MTRETAGYFFISEKMSTGFGRKDIEKMNHDNSRKLFEQALKLIPGGVNSPVRACKSVGTEPLFIKNAEGCMIYDADGNGFVDYVGSWGPMILGHRHPAVIKAISDVLDRGTSFGAPTDLEIRLAEMVIEAVPSVEMLRMVNSGTEATMSAIRLARGFTGRDTIIKFDGCYHGHADTLLVEAGSGIATLGIPGSPGVPESFAELTLSIPYNDIAYVREVMKQQGEKIACIIVEPVAGNMGLVPPADGFLETLREVTEKRQSADIRRGYDRFPGGLRRRAGIVRHFAGYYLSRKNYRRRDARGRVWRKASYYGIYCSAGSGISGRNPIRKSCGHGRRHCHS